MKPSEAAKAVSVNYEATQKRKRTYDRDAKKIPFKKINRTSNKPVSKLNDQHKAHLTNFFNETPSAIIQDAVENIDNAHSLVDPLITERG